MEKFTTSQESIKLLLRDGTRYIIPKYQREFSWKDEHVEQFFQDVSIHNSSTEKSPYFFGAMVFIEDEKNLEKYTVVDGQQRLTTTMTFIAAIRDMLSELGADIPADQFNGFLIETSDDNDGEISKLKMSKNNEEYFEQFIMKKGHATEKENQKFEHMSKTNKLLVNAYKTFVRELKVKLKEQSNVESKIKYLNSLLNNFLKYFMIIKTVVASPQYAYKIFETLNDRGLELSESDLVKNRLLDIVDHAGKNVDAAHSKWMQIYEVLEKSKDIKFDDFLRHYLLANYGATRKDQVYSRISENVTSEPQVQQFIDSLVDNAEVYRKLKNPKVEDWPRGNYRIVENLEALVDLNSKVVYPVLLAGYFKFKSNLDEFEELVEVCLTFFFRSRTICATNATALETLMTKINDNMRKGKKYCLEEIKSDLVKSNEYPINEEFEHQFSNFEANGNNALYILLKLNNHMHGGVKKMDLGPLRKNDASVEHIMPKEIKDTEWETYLKEKKGLKKESEIEDYHEQWLWKLGNLTILNRHKNAAGQNISFKKKVDKIYKDSEAKITQNLSSYHEWDDKTIKSRQENFAARALEIWKIDVKEK